MAELILASASPRRKELLALLQVPFTVVRSSYEEPPADGSRSPRAWALYLAQRKAEEVAGRCPGAVVIGADTVVALGGRVYGKPRDPEDAARMLQELSGRTHYVYTGVAVLDGRSTPRSLHRLAVGTSVAFRALEEAEIRAYVATGEPMDKAGAYGIQGYGATIVERIDGDYYAVMGLPLVTVVRLLGEVGIRYEFGHFPER